LLRELLPKALELFFSPLSSSKPNGIFVASEHMMFM
jgi:hypothetical protein